MNTHSTVLDNASAEAIFLCPDGQLMKPRRLHSVRLTWE
jgi:hypothetical protein